MPDRDSVISIMTRLQVGQSWFCILAVARVFPSSKCPGQLWVPPSLLFNGCLGLLWGVKQQVQEVTTHCHLRLRIGGAVPPLPLFAFVACVGATLPSPYLLLIPRYVQYKQAYVMMCC
jgi:hypothetical protein